MHKKIKTKHQYENIKDHKIIDSLNKSVSNGSKTKIAQNVSKKSTIVSFSVFTSLDKEKGDKIF